MNTDLTQSAKTAPRFTVTGFITSDRPLTDLLAALLAQGVARDLIEFAVRREDRDRYFPRARFRRASRLASCGHGALIGLICFALLSAVLVLVATSRNNRMLTWVMLLGPNMGIAIGGLVGYSKTLIGPRPTPTEFQRVYEHPGILVAVLLRSQAELPGLTQLFAHQGVEFLKVEAA